ncbi:hypothetical protein HGG75_27145 [Ochrobactrum pseudogrignonense]|nr:hypothetical protein [Brucella pseudogrignonensis]
MPDAKASSLLRILVAAGGIYTAQSLVGGLTFMGIPAVLRADNVALDKISLVSLVMLVWALKFLWAPTLERLRILPNGRRRSRGIMVCGEVITAALLVALGFTGAASFTMIIALLLLRRSLRRPSILPAMPLSSSNWRKTAAGRAMLRRLAVVTSA